MNRVLVWSIAGVSVLGAVALSLHGLAARSVTATSAIAARPADPVLARCRAAGEAAGGDVVCQAAWRAARDRFFGRTAP